MPTSSRLSGVVAHRDRRARREEVEAAHHGDQRLAGGGRQPRPVVVRLLRQPDVARRVVAVPQDPARVVAGTAAVARARTVRARAPSGRGAPARTPWRCPSAPSPTTTYSNSSLIGRSPGKPGQQPAADVGAVVLHRREPAVGVARDDMPRCTDSQIAQSCWLTRSQRSAASDGVEARRRRAAAAANSRTQSIRVRRPRSGRSTKAATWSADAGQHQVRVDQLALVAGPLARRQAGQRRAGRGAGHREGPRALAVRDPVVPVEAGAAAGERGHQPDSSGWTGPQW